MRTEPIRRNRQKPKREAFLRVAFFLALCSGVRAQTNGEVSDLSVAAIRNALAAEHRNISSHPKDAQNYINLAYTLIDAGDGEQARLAAAEATRTHPSNSLAFQAQGWVLHHNLIGVDYGSGFDYDGAVRSYQKAIELDPKDLDARESLANVLEFNREGVRYASDAQLPLAIDAYRYVKQHQSAVTEDTINNLSIDLFYAGRYQEALTELAPLPGTRERLGIILASTAAWKGAKEAIALSNRIEGDEQRRKDALNFAAEGLWTKRFYSQAADLLTASLPDTANGRALTAKIQLFRNLKRFTPVALPLSDPRSPVQRLFETAFSGVLRESSLQNLLSRHSYASETTWKAALQQSDHLTGTLLALMKQTGLPRNVMADIALGKMSVTAASTTVEGTSVQVQLIGQPAIPFFVVSEDGNFKIAAAANNPAEVGTQSLYLLANAKVDTAKLLLDWYNSVQDNSADEGDSRDKGLFARLWTPSAKADINGVRLAAAALVNDPQLLQAIVPEIVAERDSASTKDRMTALDELLASTYLRLGEAQKAQVAAARLLSEDPESDAAISLEDRSYELDHNWAAWKTLLQDRLQTKPNDHFLLHQSAAEAIAEKDYTRARQVYRSILDGPHATPYDYDMYAWLSLFEKSPDEAAFGAAQHASIASTNRSYRALLTLACLHAARGETAEAHQDLLDAMSGAGLSQPDAGVWYGFGRIFEQYGITDAAITAYGRATQMESSLSLRGPSSLDGTSVSTLAQMRLKGLQAAH